MFMYGYRPVNSVALVRLACSNARQSGLVADAAAYPRGQARKYVTNEAGVDYVPNLTLSECSAQQQMLRPLYISRKSLCGKNPHVPSLKCNLASHPCILYHLNKIVSSLHFCHELSVGGPRLTFQVHLKRLR